MKKLFHYLKVAAPLFFILALSLNAKAESPLSFTQIPGTADALITDIMFDGSTMRVAGNYTKVNINGTDYNADKYSEVVNNVWQTPTLTSPVRDGKFYRIDNVTYLVGNQPSGNGSIYKMQSGNWTVVRTISGKILTSTSFNSTIAIGGEFSGYLGFFQTKDNTFTTSSIPVKPVVQLASTSTQTIYRYAEVNQFGNELGGIIDNVTMQRSSVSLPNMIFLRGIGVNPENEQLYVSGQTNTSDVTYKFDGSWSLFATHGNQSHFRDFWFDNGKIYASCGTSLVNGIQMYGLAVYDGSWSSAMSDNENYSVVDIIFNNGYMYINTGLSFVVARVSTTTGIKNNITKSDIKLYPNPTVDRINITNPGDARDMPLLALNGQVIDVYTVQKNETITIDVSNLSAGVYFIENIPFTIQK